MARPTRLDWISWFTSLPASTALIACLFLPQFRDCHGDDRSAFDTSTAPMMIAMGAIGVLPLLWRVFPKRMGDYEDLAGMIGTLLALAFVVFFPVVGLFNDWYPGAKVTWAAAWVELAAMITWTSAATTRRELPLAIRARGVDRSIPTDRAA